MQPLRHTVRFGRATRALALAMLAIAQVPRAAIGQALPAIDPVGPARGALVLAGGSDLSPEIWGRFVELAGGPEASIVVIPTAGEDSDFNLGWPSLPELRAAGANDVVVVHTRDRSVADSEPFVRAIRGATGVWLPGGRTWRLAEAYLGTRVHDELAALLDRGGVIGGSSAGASIQGSLLMRGDPETNRVPFSEDYPIGFGFLRDVAVDQHLIARGRQADLWGILETRPGLLGIGLDEHTALVIHEDVGEVVGSSQVLVYDAAGPKKEQYWLADGQRLDLRTRRPIEAD